VALVSPSDKHLVESETTFAMEKQWHRIVNVIGGLPVGEAGAHTVTLSLKVGNEWKQIASFPLTIAHPAMASSPVRSQ
jgi:hypothetical protein